jgi:hypothetical protein
MFPVTVAPQESNCPLCTIGVLQQKVIPPPEGGESVYVCQNCGRIFTDSFDANQGGGCYEVTGIGGLRER